MPVPLVLDSGDYWLCLTIRQGRLFWLAETGESQIQISREKQKPVQQVGNLRLFYELGTSLDNENSDIYCMVLVENQTTALLEKQQSRLTFDPTAGLNLYCAAASPAPAQVTFISA